MTMPTLTVEVAFSTGADTGTLLQLDDPTRGKLNTGTLAAPDVDVPIWTDITDWVRSGTISRGSNRVDNPIVTYEAGQTTIVLRNDERRFDPSYLDGPYTAESTIQDGTEVILNSNSGFEAGTTTGWFANGATSFTAATDQAYSGTYSGKIVPNGVTLFSDILANAVSVEAGQAYRLSARVRMAVSRNVQIGVHWLNSVGAEVSGDFSDQVSVAAGAWDLFERDVVAPVGAVSAVMDITMGNTPPAGHIMWVDEGTISHLPYRRTTQVTAMRAVRIMATWAGVVYELFRGYADQWDVQWFEPDYSECTLTATDAFKILSGIDRTAVAPVGAGEASGARVARILDSVAWEAVDRQIATGDCTVQATDLSGDALAELQTVTASELGELYADGGGRIVFRNRRAMLTDTRSLTSQATFGDGGGAELPYQGLAIAADDATFFNEVRVTRSGGTEQTATDAASLALYYAKTYRPATEPILQTDAAALDYARWLLHVASDPELRFTELMVNPRYDAAALFPHVLGRLLGDRITVIRRPPGGGDPITKDQFIRGVEHTFAPESWSVTWALQDASRYGSFFVLNHASLGELDRNALSF